MTNDYASIFSPHKAKLLKLENKIEGMLFNIHHPERINSCRKWELSRHLLFNPPSFAFCN